MQIYNEKLYDLLQDEESKHPLVIRENKINGIYVQGLAEYIVTNMDDCLTLLFRGERNRITRQTRLNMFSSRSHTIFQILLENTKVDQQGKLKRAKLNLCDLAGSEKIGAEANLTGKHFEELKNINTSLTTLGKVISALSTKSSHVPYRDSKLTRLLQDSIGGNTRTCLIATVAPLADCADETISTLMFANRAKKVTITAQPNEINASDDALVKKLQQELQYMKDLLQLKRKGGISDLHRQLLLLQHENDKLRDMHLDNEQVEKLKMENKMMRLELQKVKDTGSVLHDNDSVSNMQMTASHIQEKTYDRTNTRNTPDSTCTEPPNKRSHVKSCVSAEPGMDYSRQIQNRRLEERGQEVERLRRTMGKMGRCPICTLPIPCKHYKTSEEMKQLGENEKKSLTKTTSTLNQQAYASFNKSEKASVNNFPIIPTNDFENNIVFTNSPSNIHNTFGISQAKYPQKYFTYVSHLNNRKVLKEAALRSIDKRYGLGSGPNSYIGTESIYSNPVSCGQSHVIRMKGTGNRFETHKGSINAPYNPKMAGKSYLRYQMKESNNRLRALQELDKKREVQLAKEIAALEEKRKLQEEETKRRINLKKVRLAETGPISAKSPSVIMTKGDRDQNQQLKFMVLVLI